MAKKAAKKKAPAKTAAKKAPAKKYRAAGFDKAGVQQIVDDAEYNHMGLSSYPWPKKLKADMVDKAEGARDVAGINAVIEELKP